MPTFSMTNMLEVLENKRRWWSTYPSQLRLWTALFPYINSTRRNHTSFFRIKSSHNHWEDAKEDGMEYHPSIRWRTDADASACGTLRNGRSRSERQKLVIHLLERKGTGVKRSREQWRLVHSDLTESWQGRRIKGWWGFRTVYDTFYRRRTWIIAN